MIRPAAIALVAMTFLLLAATGPRAAPLDGAFTYQGELLQSGVPANGAFDMRFQLFDDAAGGGAVGSALLRNEVDVSQGLFAVELDVGLALVADRQLWLAIEVRSGASTGAYTLLTPRQKLTLAPAAGYALGAGVADSALSLSAENVLRVSPDGAPYATVGAALAAVSAAGASNRWLIDVGPGVYAESGPLTIPGYVHVRGAGPSATVLRSNNSGVSASPGAAVLVMQENSALSDIAVENTAAGFAIGIYMSTPVSRATRLDNVHASATGNGGTGHYALYLNQAEPLVSDSVLRSTGASLVDAAVGVIGGAGGFPRPLFVDSRLLGAAPADAFETCTDNGGTGYGLQGINAAPVIRRSFVCGGDRAISVGTNGSARVEFSTMAVSGATGAFLVETTAAASVLISHSRVNVGSNKYTGTGGLVCVLVTGSSNTQLSDGFTPATACNN